MKTLQITDKLYEYVVTHTPLPHPQLKPLIEETTSLPNAMMQIAPDQGSLMHFLAKLIGAKRCLEVGCFTGFSAIAVATALPSDGKLIAMDINPETAAIARRHATAAGVGGIIDIRIAPADETFGKLHAEFGDESFDLAFIDADKTNYDTYYEHCLKLVRRGGLIMVDNVLWSGHVLDASDVRPDTVAIRALNDKIAADERVDRVLLHISDGIYLLRKR